LAVAAASEVVYRQTLPTMSSDLHVVRSELGARAGVVGAITLAAENAVAPESIERLLAARTVSTERAVETP
jgi:hypothetical protein